MMKSPRDDPAKSVESTAHRILVLIHYPVDVGYAVGRLIGVFYRMAVQCTKDRDGVHFAFPDLKGGHCDALPSTFENYLTFEPRRPNAEAINRLIDYVTANRIDTIFGFDLDLRAAFLTEARQAGIRTVIAYYGAPLGTVLPWPLYALRRLEVKWLCRNGPDLVIVESQAMLRTALYGRGVPREKLRVIRNGVSLRHFSPHTSKDFVYTQFDIPRDRRIVVYMGHFHERKGVHVLLHAADYIVNSLGRKDIHFLFLGTREPDVTTMRGLVNFSRFESHICLGGYQRCVPEILSGCALGCIPTSGWDSFPLSPLEMQACGLPVIVSDCQGVAETVLDSVTGIVVPAGDSRALASAIVGLLDDPERCAAMGLAARKRIEDELTDDRQVELLAAAVQDAWALTGKH